MIPPRPNPGDVGRPEMLGVLDPEPPVARSVRPRQAVVDVEDQAVGPLADGVHRHLQPGGIGSADPGPQRILGRDQEPGRLGSSA